MIGIIALVRDNCFGLDALDQFVGLRDVVALARAKQQSDGIAKRVGRGVDLGAQPAPRSAQALGIRSPLAILAPAACW